MDTPVLFDPARHEPLSATRWDAARARAAITTIVADIERAHDPERGWPVHPLDDEQPPEDGFQSLYLGSAGVVWALGYLARQGAVTLALQPERLAARLHADYLAAPDTESVVPSYFLGEAGILLVDWQFNGEPEVADRLFEVIRINIPNVTNEALWAAPGTMVAAWHMWRWTGEARWRALFVENVDQLFATWQWSDTRRCHLWTQDMYGRVTQYLGAGHGFAGNADALLRGAALLSSAQCDTLLDRCAETLAATALRSGQTVNWRPRADHGEGEPPPLVQWCHGAPGMVTGLAHYPRGRSAVVDDLLLAAGHAVWASGPLVKGHGLCHGTAGNGYAFLALHARTGDALWLDRARAFAMHAIEQQARMREQHGRGRYTLWTGDPGLAVYLWHCIEGRGGLPGLDVVD